MKPYRLQEVRLSLVRSDRPTFEVSSPEQVAAAFADLAHEVRESLYAVYLSGSNKILGVEQVSTGSIGQTVAEPAEILRSALLIGCRALLLVHNHISDNPTPSANDRSVTAAVSKTARLFGIDLLDHIIVGHGGTYFSFKQHGLMPRRNTHQADAA